MGKLTLVFDIYKILFAVVRLIISSLQLNFGMYASILIPISRLGHRITGTRGCNTLLFQLLMHVSH